MFSRAQIDDILSRKSLALVGVSRNGQGFGHAIRKELTARGYTLHLVHHEVDVADGQPCARSLKDVAGKVEGVILVTAPPATTRLVREADEAGIKRIWMQQGAESPEAIAYCAEHGLTEVHGECALMFAGHARGLHGFHRWIRKVTGKLPA